MSEPTLNQFVLSFDVDWAPDCAIDFVVDVLVEKQIKATWFVTHDSPGIERLFQHNNIFELGIHPNFLPNSTHGNSIKEVLTHIAQLVPNSKIMRTHCLTQSTEILETSVSDFGIEIDASLFLMGMSNIQPHLLFLNHDVKGLIRIPYFFEDDFEMFSPAKSWKINDGKYHVSGLKVFNFHPMYIYLNSDSMHKYRELKNYAHLHSLDYKACEPFINRSIPGTKDLFIQLCEYIVNEQRMSYTLSDIAQLWGNKL
jgi:hypothetical protein|tara:strand:+ start:200 stop:964 length:765 start_codon:yes stop_codon:yes gene_type:complete